MLNDLIEKYGIDNLVCKHRHGWNSKHNSCFLKGEVRPKKGAVPINKVEEKPKTWYGVEKLKIGYLDIESDGLKVDFSTLLSWCIKDRDGEIHSAFITKQELFSGELDKKLVESCIEKLSEYDIIVTYYGSKFDIPFLRAKAFHYNIPFPEFVIESNHTKTRTVIKAIPELYHFDLYYLVKAKFYALSSRSLDNVCSYLGIVGKTPLEKDTWRAGKYGDAEAIQEILVHNKADVIILEELHKRLEGLSKWTKAGI